MKQEYDQYTKEDFEVWKTLYDRQSKNLRDKSAEEYLNCLDKFDNILIADKIPDFNELNKFLIKNGGWQIHVVKGLIPVEEFFQLLVQKKFPSSTWLRSKEMLDYLEEPDMFHDIFGHVPLLINKEFGEFAQKLGELGVKHIKNDEIVVQLQRIYWFTIEFGLIKENNNTKVYGAGIMSSFGETNHIFEDDIIIEDYNITSIIHKEFITTEIQKEYVLIDDFTQLYKSLLDLDKLVGSDSN